MFTKMDYGNLGFGLTQCRKKSRPRLTTSRSENIVRWSLEISQTLSWWVQTLTWIWLLVAVGAGRWCAIASFNLQRVGSLLLSIENNFCEDFSALKIYFKEILSFVAWWIDDIIVHLIKWKAWLIMSINPAKLLWLRSSLWQQRHQDPTDNLCKQFVLLSARPNYQFKLFIKTSLAVSISTVNVFICINCVILRLVTRILLIIGDK